MSVVPVEAMRHPVPLEVELPALVSCPMWVLGTEFGPLEGQHEPSPTLGELFRYVLLWWCRAWMALRTWVWLTTIASFTPQPRRGTEGSGKGLMLILRVLIGNL